MKVKAKPVQVLIDESALVGPLDSIDTALNVGRGFGLRLHFAFQSIGQLSKCFPEQETTFLSNVTPVFFGIPDQTTAEKVSSMLGDFTLTVQSSSTTEGTSWQTSDITQPSSSRSGNYSRTASWQLQARRLCKPEELLTLDPRIAISFPKGVDPVCTYLVRHYEEDFRPRAANTLWSKVAVVLLLTTWLVRCAVTLVAAGGAAGLAYMAIHRIGPFLPAPVGN